jgi:predicted DNA binding CopG/RHH family protein
LERRQCREEEESEEEAWDGFHGFNEREFDPLRRLSYTGHTMSVLTIRISEKEKAALAKRAKAEGLTPSALVRRMISEQPFVTADDLLKELERRMGDKSLRVRRKK